MTKDDMKNEDHGASSADTSGQSVSEKAQNQVPGLGDSILIIVFEVALFVVVLVFLWIKMG